MNNVVDLKSLCEQGRFKEFNTLFSAFEIQAKMDFIQADNFLFFHLVASKGYLEFLEFFIQCIFESVNAHCWDDDEALIVPFEARRGEGFKEALKQGHEKVVQFFLDDDLPYLNNACFEIMLAEAEFISLTWHHPQLKYLIPSLITHACSISLAALERILSIVPNEELLKVIAEQTTWGPFEVATFNNRDEIISYLWEQCTPALHQSIVQNNFQKCVICAVKEVNFEALQAILALLNQKQKIIILSTDGYNPFVYAADRGSLPMVNLLWHALSSDQQMQALQASNFAAYRLATQNHHEEVIGFLESVCPPLYVDDMKKAVGQTVKG